MYEYETKYHNLGYQVIGGCDEAGRGPMAGPLVASMVILDPSYEIKGLNDSKQLTEKKRDKLFDEIIILIFVYGLVEEENPASMIILAG